MRWPSPMDDQNKNLILATALSFIVILVWFVLFPPPEPEQLAEQPAPTVQDAEGGLASVPQAAGTITQGDAPTADTREGALADAPRIEVETPRLIGSISLLGGRIDDLSLKDYRETLDDESPIVTMLSPVNGANAYYALYGWAAGAGLTADLVPGPNTSPNKAQSPWNGTMVRASLSRAKFPLTKTSCSTSRKVLPTAPPEQSPSRPTVSSRGMGNRLI